MLSIFLTTTGQIYIYECVCLLFVCVCSLMFVALRSGQHENKISSLYEIEDDTGVLSRHRDKLLSSFTKQQVDMKIMYYELIKMLMDHEREHQGEEEHKITKAVDKIDGYQHLTNKLQRYINNQFNSKILEMQERCDSIINNIGDVNIMMKFSSLEQNYLQLKEENQRLVERINILDNHSSKFSEEYRISIETKFKDLSGTKERLEKTIEMIGDNKTTLNHLIEKTDKHDDDLNYLKSLKSVDNDTVVEMIKNLNNDVMIKVDQKSEALTEKITLFQEEHKKEKKDNDECVAILFESVDKVKKTVETNQDELKTVHDFVGEVNEKQKEMRQEMDVSADNIEKNVKGLRNVEAGVENLENRTTETVERMKEVTVLASKIDNSVQVLEKKMGEENVKVFDMINTNLEQINIVSGEISSLKISIEEKQRSFDGDLKNVEVSVDGLKNNFEMRLDSLHKDQDTKIAGMATDVEDVRSKIVLLEEGHNVQVNRFQMMEGLGSRLTTVEEARQMSDARIKDDMEESLRQSQADMENKKADLERRLQSMQDQIESITNSINNQKTNMDQSLVELQDKSNKSQDTIAQLMTKTEEIRTSVYQELQTSIQEKISQVSILVKEVETKSKDVSQSFKEEQRQEMKSIETQLNTIYQEYEKMEKSLNDFRSQYGDDFKGLTEADKNQADSIAKTDEKMNAIMEQANTLMLNDARQDEALEKLDNRVKVLEDKHASLEEADVFLQESQRQITEKATNFEDIVRQDFEEVKKKMSQVEAIKVDMKEVDEKQQKNWDEVDILKQQLLSVNGQIDKIQDLYDNLNSIHADLNLKVTEEMKNLVKTDEKLREQLESFQQETFNDIENIRNKEDTLDSGFKDMLNTSNSFTTNIENVEEELKRIQKTMIELDFKTQNSSVVESLSAQVFQLNEEKKVVEEKTLADIDYVRNKLNELESDSKTTLEKVQELDTYAQGVNIKVEELENTFEDRMNELTTTSNEQIKEIETKFVTEVTERIEVVEKEAKSLEETFELNAAKEAEKLKAEMDEKFLNLFTIDTKNQQKFIEILETLGRTDERIENTAKYVKEIQEDKALLVEKIDNQKDSIEQMFADLENFSAVKDEMRSMRESQSSQIISLNDGFDNKIDDLQKLFQSLDVKFENNLQNSGKTKMSFMICK